MRSFRSSRVAPAALAMIVAAGMLGSAMAQMPDSNVASASAKASPVTIKRGGHGILTVTINVAPNFHINANKPADPDLIPTTITAAASGVAFGAPKFPTPKSIAVSYEKQPMLVYQNRATVLVPFDVSKSAKPGKVKISAAVNYQGCNAESCYPPSSASTGATITVK